MNNLKLSPNYFDFIILDEAHHGAASSYRTFLNYFQPKVLLGLTATPERMDNENILEDFCNRIAAEIRLSEALNKKLLKPKEETINFLLSYSRSIKLLQLKSKIILVSKN